MHYFAGRLFIIVVLADRRCRHESRGQETPRTPMRAKQAAMWLTLLTLALFKARTVAAGDETKARSQAAPKRLLVIGEEKGYRHEAVSHAMATIERLGRTNRSVGHHHPHRHGAADQEEARIQRQKPERFRRGAVLHRRTLEMDEQAEGRLPFLHPRRWQGLHRRAQRHHHLHQMARIRRHDRRLSSTSIPGARSMRPSSSKTRGFRA